jgi:long-chain acyl-CoA synthetase
VQRRLFDATTRIGWRRFQARVGGARWSPGMLAWPLLERVVARKILRAFGGRLKFAVSGGAPLSPHIAKALVSLGVPIYQGYGLTEASPTVTVNRIDDNDPTGIGKPLPGVEVRIGPQDELLTRGSQVMLGYWHDASATEEAIDADGWLHTGDQARVDENGHYHLFGRLKEIIVLASGEKLPPSDMEAAIALDPLFEQVMIVGEGRPHLAALVVLEERRWRDFADELSMDPDAPAVLSDRFIEHAVLLRIATGLREFPGFARVRRVHLSFEPWTVEDGLLTPTLKLRRPQIARRYAREIEALFEGRNRDP